MKNLLPNDLYEKISSDYNLDYVSEIRIRLYRPIIVCYHGRYEILHGRDGYNLKEIIATGDLISYILSVATKQSFYAYASQIKNGFITTDSGIRIGLCGTVVENENKVSTIKNITSLNIRIPHNVVGCSSSIIDLICFNGQVKNTLVISPPGAGKTTLIRDIANKLSTDKKVVNILIADERNEIAGQNNMLIDGKFIDVISSCEKSYAFKVAIKTMNPSVIVTDEISEMKDFEEIIFAKKSGVKVVASAHLNDIGDLKNDVRFCEMLKNKIFERIVVLSKRNSVGTIEAVYDENLQVIYYK